MHSPIWDRWFQTEHDLRHRSYFLVEPPTVEEKMLAQMVGKEEASVLEDGGKLKMGQRSPSGRSSIFMKKRGSNGKSGLKTIAKI